MAGTLFGDLPYREDRLKDVIREVAYKPIGRKIMEDRRDYLLKFRREKPGEKICNADEPVVKPEAL